MDGITYEYLVAVSHVHDSLSGVDPGAGDVPATIDVKHNVVNVLIQANAQLELPHLVDRCTVVFLEAHQDGQSKLQVHIKSTRWSQ